MHGTSNVLTPYFDQSYVTRVSQETFRQRAGSGRVGADPELTGSRAAISCSDGYPERLYGRRLAHIRVVPVQHKCDFPFDSIDRKFATK